MDRVVFGYRRGSDVIHPTTWTLPEGRRTVLMGPNGAGKSTLLKILAGAHRPTRGSVLIDGTPVNARTLRRRVAWMPQDIAPIPGLRVHEQVAYAAWLGGLSTKAASTASRPALVPVGLQDKADDRVETLSGGQLRRLGLAEVLVRDASAVILDEPTAGLDPAQRQAFREILQGIEGTVLVSSHQLDDIDELFDWATVLVGGRIVWDGSVQDLFQRIPDPGSRRAGEELFASFVMGGLH